MELGELTRRAFVAWNDRRFEQLLREFFHEHAVWDMTPFGLPGVGEYKGHEGLRRFFAEWLEAFPDSSVEVVEVEARGAWTLAVVEQRVTGGTSGTPVPFRYGGIGRWRDERLEYVQNHPDLYAARTAYDRYVAAYEATRPRVGA